MGEHDAPRDGAARSPDDDPRVLFGQLEAVFRDDSRVTWPETTGGGKFGAGAIKVNGKIFAMLMGDDLVVKLPRARVDALIELGLGNAFTASRGRPMKEWIAVPPRHSGHWRDLVVEARAFVGAA